ncbi:AtpZ/AtpI family protein [Mesorhizobium qingshengii]|uniref:ATP synthase protein I n=1 Tax=Mesorhizobium qingshengii TaxID=1165689 RepID=A0ABT4QN52_9HYPH|nr:AtpZ/AtpI family protein [Mesorhizobium qingshengii]MCZ8542984.1 AtpZ/AtpI family protein [Mesorhizobium qingshengii]
MADKNRPDGTGETGRGKQHEPDIRDDDLERRRRELEASLATRLPNRLEGKDDAKAGSAAGYGQAVKLSSEFIAGVVVGAGIGWIIDRMAGTSPWGLIVFLLLGFGAGVLNVMRSAGVVAEFGQGDKSRSDRDDRK